jgi:class 3 adenylate cyclase
LIDLKCGMNTGEVLFGLLDTQTRSEVTVIGSTVNLASRIESIAVKDQIIVSEQTKKLVQEKFAFNRINVKGKIQSYPEIEFVYKVDTI